MPPTWSKCKCVIAVLFISCIPSDSNAEIKYGNEFEGPTSISIGSDVSM